MVEGGQGREQDCRRHAHEALVLAEQLGIKPFMHDIDEGLGLLELVRGDIDRAIEALERSISVPGGQRNLQLRPSMPDLVEAYVRAGRPPRRPARASSPASTPRPSRYPSCPRSRPAAAGSSPPTTSSTDHFGDAVRLFEAAELPFQLARTALNYGERLRRTRSPPRGACAAARRARGLRPARRHPLVRADRERTARDR